MLYLLPTKGKQRYNGVKPHNIRSWSSGSTDIDGAKCVHWETNCGERYTCSYDRLDMDAVNAARSHLGVSWLEFVKGMTPLNYMTQEQYDEWLARIREGRAENASKSPFLPIAKRSN